MPTIAALRAPLQVVAKTAPYNSHAKALTECLDSFRAVVEAQADALQDMRAELEQVRAQLASLTPPPAGA